MRKRLVALLAAGGLGVVAAAQPAPAVAAGPAVSFSATAIDFGSAPWLQAAPTQNLVLTNTGDAPLNVCCVDMSGDSFVPQDFIVFLDQCSFHTINPGGQCGVSIRFTPQTGGPRTATVSIFDNAPGSPQQVTLTGTGTGPVIRFTPDSLQFANVPAGTTSAPQTFSAVNAGDAPVTFSSVALDPAPSLSSWFAITADACSGKTVGPGQRCSISVTATPDAVTVGIQLVNFFDNAGTGKQTYNFDKSLDGLQATGAGPLLGTFGPVPAFIQDARTTSAATRIQIFDAGTDPLHISSVAVDNPAAGFSVTADTCTGATLTVDTLFTSPSRCHVDVVFAPAAAGQVQSNLVFTDNELHGSHSVLLTGSGLAPAGEVSTSAIDFGFQTPGVTSAPRFITLTNPTSQALAVSGVSLSGANPNFFQLTGDTCSGTTVAGGGSCSVGVTFLPPFPYLFSAALSFADNAQRSPQTVSLRGEGQSPTFTISTSRLDFGNVHGKVASASQTITVTNTSAGPLSFGYLGDLPINRSGCTGQIAAGATCTVSVSVTPPVPGPQTGVLKVVDSSSNQQVIEVDWTGVSGEASIESTIGGQLVQRVGDTASGFVIVTNTGLDALVIGQVSLPANPAVTITADGCSNQTLAPAGRCVISATVHPTVVGSWNATLSMPTDAAFSANPSTFAFSGIASPPPQPVFSPGSVLFPAQDVGAPETARVVWLDNGLVPSLGLLPLKVASVAVGGPDASSFRVVWDGCSGLSISGAYSCPVEVGFAPTTAGTLNASLLFSDDGAGSPQALPLTGVGTVPATASPRQVDFGQVPVNTRSAPSTVTLSNTGTSAFSVGKVSISGTNKGDYSTTSDNCSNQTLSPGQSCQVAVVFRPEATGASTATLSFADTAANSPQTVSLTGTGLGK